MEQLLAGKYMFFMCCFALTGILFLCTDCVLRMRNLCAHSVVIHPDPNQMIAMQGMGDEEAMMNLAIALSLNEVSQN